MIPLAVIAGWSGDRWLTTARLAMDTPVPAIAEVEQFYDELPLGPWLLTAQGRVGSTTADGRKAATDIAVPDPAPAGDDTLGIECAAEKPSAVRIPGDPGLPRGPWVSGTATLPALGRPAWCAVATCRTLRQVLCAARSPHSRPLDHLVLPDGEEPASEPSMLLLLAPGADRPTALAYVRPGAPRVPVQGVDHLHEVPGNPWVVADVDDCPVRPFGPLIDPADKEEAEGLREYVAHLLPPGVRLTDPAAGEPPQQPAAR
ncbi:hypothetical protein ACFY40_31225 [Streptomyces sp. NPDC012950]|uniref:hypothetical protein n=1 Tax=Streptomyces sp. NPDC012950 TaxID=3364858 RepID=UPI00369301BE